MKHKIAALLVLLAVVCAVLGGWGIGGRAQLPLTAVETANFPVPTEADAPSVYLSAADKRSFAAEMDRRYAEQSLERNTEAPVREVVDALLLQIPNASPVEKEAINAELASCGVYEFEAPVIGRQTETEDVTLAAPGVYYEAWSANWSITCGGHWNNNNYGDVIGNVGGPDGFGVGFTSTSDTYRSSVVNASACLTDQSGRYDETTKNRSDGDGNHGFGFRLQDKWKLGTAYYIGDRWAGVCTYDKNFSSYDGVATAYYIHTYGSASISEITFGVNGNKAGINAKISTENKSFIAYSSDKVFGTYQ